MYKGVTVLVVFANNQTLVTMQGSPTTIFSDPVPLGSNDRATGASNVHSMITQGGTVSLIYTGQVSLDGGTTWNDTAFTDTLTAVGNDLATGAVLGVLLRIKYVFQMSGGSAGQMAACCFDLHVNLDHD